ncbi:MAG: hypothetical protein E7259_03520 [Lachnospiraceae bacterium]|nr:hypothetical protein [Lachnospiraceae bacterium]
MADSVVNAITNTQSTYTSNTTKEATNDLDKEAFLQMLVTQMQYQDPLNPSDSTQYMSQLAQYSSLEATMNISSTIEQGNGLNLVGQYVIMNTTDAAGNSQMISGLVQYATVKDGEVLLSINDSYYPASDLDSVVDYDYYLYLNGLAEDGKLNEDGTVTDGSESSSEEEKTEEV